MPEGGKCYEDKIKEGRGIEIMCCRTCVILDNVVREVFAEKIEIG